MYLKQLRKISNLWQKLRPEGSAHLKGSLELIGSALSFSLMTVCVKNLQGRIPVTELVFIRALISLVITRLMIRKIKLNPWGDNKKLLLVRGILGSGALLCIFQAIDSLPLAHATTIQYTYPTFTVIAGWIFLKESLQRKIIVAVLLGWIGITFVVQPQWISNSSQVLSINAICIALCGAGLTSLAYICVRQLSKSEHELVIIHYFPLTSVPITLPFVFSQGVLPIGIEWLWLLGIGVFTQIGQLGITRGLRLLPAARASSINYTQVLFATIWGILIFSEPINEYFIIGTVLILGATLICVSTKHITLNN